MGNRNYPNFIDSYLDYARDNFVPDKFHFWAAVSIVAAALERKVWLPWSDKFNFYPNMYVLLVSQPGIGKSSAINPARSLLMSVPYNQINFISEHITEAQLIIEMSQSTSFESKGGIHNQSAGYYVASEASAVLKNTHGDIIGPITSFYDCDDTFSKGTVKNGVTQINNLCFNLLAGTTFSYLGELLKGSNIMGGFASRCTYIIQDELVERRPTFQNRGKTEKTHGVSREKLREDLTAIHALTGEMRATPEFADIWENWYYADDQERQKLKSEKLQALKARKNTNIIKMSMLLCAAEGNDLLLTAEHWKRAVSLIEEVEDEIPGMLREGDAQAVGTQKGLNAAIMKVLMKAPQFTLPYSQFIQEMILAGYDRANVISTVEGFRSGESNLIEVLSTTDGKSVRLVGNANNYL